MKNLSETTRTVLKNFAKSNLARTGEHVRLSPWMLVLPPWKQIRRFPFFGSVIVTGGLLLLVLVTNLEKLNLIFLVKHIAVAIEIFLGFYVAFYSCSLFEKMYLDLKSMTLLPESTFRRWFLTYISKVWGSINLLPPEERSQYTLRKSWSRDKITLIQFFFWAVVNGLIFLLGARMFPPHLDVGWVFQAGFLFLWAYSFVWTGYFIPSSIIFLSKLEKLPMRYFFAMPNSLSLKRIGGKLVKQAWVFSCHYWVLLVLFILWDVFTQTSLESDAFFAAKILIILLIMCFYLAWLFMGVVMPQFALTKNLRKYNQRRLAEYALQTERQSANFIKHPDEQTFEQLIESKNYIKLFRTLPKFSLDAWSLVSLVLLVVINVSATYAVIYSEVGGFSELMELMSPLMN